MKRISLLGSTGSIGLSTLSVARNLGSQIVKIVGLAARNHIELLEQQAHEFNPEIIGVYDKEKAYVLKKKLPHLKVVGGLEGIEEVAAHSTANLTISAIAGTMGLSPTAAAIKAGKAIGLANKEALVSGGAVIMKMVKEKGVPLIPIDSEHSALFQCLKDENSSTIRRLIITWSGGPLRDFQDNDFETVTVEQALNHPNWRMGPKVTIDSSTMMNKGLELIEAHWLFGIPQKQIEILIHPQSIIHSLVEFVDGSILAQLGEPTMLIPIQYAITYPGRQPGLLQPFDFTKHSKLEFKVPDTQRFRCLDLAYFALEKGGSLPCYMNAVNEVLVNRFLNREISWKDISSKLEKLMEKHAIVPIHSLEDVLAIDRMATEEARYA